MNQQALSKEVVTVTEMARMCGLSRARFYQLIGEGIFPAASRNQQTGRPFFSRDQQERCLLIRRTNRGANQKAVMFYGLRVESLSPPPRKRKPLSKRKPSSKQKQRDPTITELRHGLTQLGVANTTDEDVRQALATAYPDGHRAVESTELLRAVFEVLQAGRRNNDAASEEQGT